MYCCANITEKDLKLSCKGILRDSNSVDCQKVHDATLFYARFAVFLTCVVSAYGTFC